MTSDYSFDKSRRLLNAADYRAVFDEVDWKVSSKELLCLSRANGSDYPRLGLVVAKKNVRQAVQRNRVKRIIRESFRLHQHQIPHVDMVILVRKGVDQLTNEQLHNEISKLWKRLQKKVSGNQQNKGVKQQ